jgi:hypothetical protein
MCGHSSTRAHSVSNNSFGALQQSLPDEPSMYLSTHRALLAHTCTLLRSCSLGSLRKAQLDGLRGNSSQSPVGYQVITEAVHDDTQMPCITLRRHKSSGKSSLLFDNPDRIGFSHLKCIRISFHAVYPTRQKGDPVRF